MAANKVELEIYKRSDGKTWAWRLKVGSNIIATDGGQGYVNRQTCIDMAEAVVGGEYWEDVEIYLIDN